MCTSTPHLANPLPTPSPATPVTNAGKTQAQSATNSAKLAGGFGSTLLTGPQGLNQTANTAPKTLLGG
ncbi:MULTISPECIES: hypothetical protein [unclassified Saccharibacter]|uniref:hypothetical protein n=1 Tax=unclassified Saccharibacter TaxID=2648722 RepID=UPI00132C19E1|nr:MULTISPECIES: hypothetical protein [unclassified Saccharibacter]MXV35859.1 hypothetical protein [Saccharibacter sp. EH611]MXV57979.1 hypothetical protein [Saccharibacter sp. EH70]MXV66374.1 hypothetical protein [Saccharibacter sp. EH60]